MVPRGGIELLAMYVTLHHFSDDGFPVYPSMYPAFTAVPGALSSSTEGGSPSCCGSRDSCTRRNPCRNARHIDHHAMAEVFQMFMGVAILGRDPRLSQGSSQKTSIGSSRFG